VSSEKLPVTVIIITRNEERNITQCLEGVVWADEIIVVDSESTDRTVEIARHFTEKIFVRKWEGYAATKEFALNNASYEWIFWLDADERVSEELEYEIRTIVYTRKNSYAGYEVARRAFFLGKWIKHCGWYPGYVVRLFQKSKTKFVHTRVHEKVEVSGTIGRLKHDLLHYTDNNLFHYFAKFNMYTSLAAQDLEQTGRAVSLYDIVARPPFMFFKMYVLKLGFLDGIHGFLLSLLSASYVFVKYAKLLELRQRKS
jgi:glycosyltransferase involved in cell wall biosynthesis